MIGECLGLNASHFCEMLRNVILQGLVKGWEVCLNSIEDVFCELPCVCSHFYNMESGW